MFKRIGYGKNKVRNLKYAFDKITYISRWMVGEVKRVLRSPKCAKFIVIRKHGKLIKKEVATSIYNRVTPSSQLVIEMRRLTALISTECSKAAVVSYFKSNEKAEREDIKEINRCIDWILIDKLADIKGLRDISDLIADSLNIQNLIIERRNTSKEKPQEKTSNSETVTEEPKKEVIEVKEEEVIVSEKEVKELPKVKQNSLVEIDSNGHVILEDTNTQTEEVKSNIEIREEADLDLEEELTIIDSRHKNRDEIVRQILEKPNQDRTEAERVYVFGKDYKKQDIDLTHRIVLDEDGVLKDVDEMNLSQFSYVAVSSKGELLDILDIETGSLSKVGKVYELTLEETARLNCKLLLETDKSEWSYINWLIDYSDDMSDDFDRMQEFAEDQLGKIQENPEYEQIWLRDRMAEWVKLANEEQTDNSAISD